MSKKLTTKGIGQIGNYYGGLEVLEKDGKYYWVIKNYDTDMDDLENLCDDWQEITKELYDSLIKFNNL